MKTLIIYDSAYGNTEKLAHAMAKGIADEVNVERVRDSVAIDFQSLDALIVGSPTHGGRPTEAIDKFLRAIPEGVFNGMKVAVFDTRLAREQQGFWLRMLMNVIDFASPRMGKILLEKGATLTVEPEGFIVEDKKGPLKKGELARARMWASSIVKESL